jgi:hypothetical protein
MKCLLAALLLATAVACASAGPPKPEPVDRLLAAMEAEATVKSVRDYFTSVMKGTYENILRARPVSEEQRLKLEALSRELAERMNDELSWERMKAMYEQTYAETFTAQEIEALSAFYESPAGKAFLKKMPMVTQKSMGVAQVRIDGLTNRLNAGIREIFDEKK